jgi:hypothetical protein
MRLTFLRWSVPCIVALSAVVCGSMQTGLTQSTTSNATVSPAANVRATGNLTFASCSSKNGCNYQGLITNDGPDCASNVRGVTHLFDVSGKELEMQKWEILGRVRRGDTSYTGCCFSQTAVDAHRTYRTDVSFDALPCI